MLDTKTATVSDRMAYFFDAGLRFSCQQCGKCCTGEPGTIYVSALDIDNIAAFLGLSVRILVQRSLRPYRDSYTIQELQDGSCLFYEKGCTIYPVRPGQCRSFPFWRKNLRSAYAWKQASKACPGIGSGQVHSRQEILDILEFSPL